jgi:hypothetical protein
MGESQVNRAAIAKLASPRRRHIPSKRIRRYGFSYHSSLPQAGQCASINLSNASVQPLQAYRLRPFKVA